MHCSYRNFDRRQKLVYDGLDNTPESASQQPKSIEEMSVDELLAELNRATQKTDELQVAVNLLMSRVSSGEGFRPATVDDDGKALSDGALKAAERVSLTKKKMVIQTLQALPDRIKGIQVNPDTLRQQLKMTEDSLTRIVERKAEIFTNTNIAIMAAVAIGVFLFTKPKGGETKGGAFLKNLAITGAVVGGIGVAAGAFKKESSFAASISEWYEKYVPFFQKTTLEESGDPALEAPVEVLKLGSVMKLDDALDNYVDVLGGRPVSKEKGGFLSPNEAWQQVVANVNALKKQGPNSPWAQLQLEVNHPQPELIRDLQELVQLHLVENSNDPEVQKRLSPTAMKILKEKQAVLGQLENSPGGLTESSRGLINDRATETEKQIKTIEEGALSDWRMGMISLQTQAATFIGKKPHVSERVRKLEAQETYIENSGQQVPEDLSSQLAVLRLMISNGDEMVTHLHAATSGQSAENPLEGLIDKLDELKGNALDKGEGNRKRNAEIFFDWALTLELMNDTAQKNKDRIFNTEMGEEGFQVNATTVAAALGIGIASPYIIQGMGVAAVNIGGAIAGALTLGTLKAGFGIAKGTAGFATQMAFSKVKSIPKGSAAPFRGQTFAKRGARAALFAAATFAAAYKNYSEAAEVWGAFEDTTSLSTLQRNAARTGKIVVRGLAAGSEVLLGVNTLRNFSTMRTGNLMRRGGLLLAIEGAAVVGSAFFDKLEKDGFTMDELDKMDSGELRMMLQRTTWQKITQKALSWIPKVGGAFDQAGFRKRVCTALMKQNTENGFEAEAAMRYLDVVDDDYAFDPDNVDIDHPFNKAIRYAKAAALYDADGAKLKKLKGTSLNTLDDEVMEAVLDEQRGRLQELVSLRTQVVESTHVPHLQAIFVNMGMDYENIATFIAACRLAAQKSSGDQKQELDNYATYGTVYLRMMVGGASKDMIRDDHRLVDTSMKIDAMSYDDITAYIARMKQLKTPTELGKLPPAEQQKSKANQQRIFDGYAFRFLQTLSPGGNEIVVNVATLKTEMIRQGFADNQALDHLLAQYTGAKLSKSKVDGKWRKTVGTNHFIYLRGDWRTIFNTPSGVTTGWSEAHKEKGKITYLSKLYGGVTYYYNPEFGLAFTEGMPKPTDEHDLDMGKDGSAPHFDLRDPGTAYLTLGDLPEGIFDGLVERVQSFHNL